MPDTWSTEPEGPLAEIATAIGEAAEQACGDRDGIRVIYTVADENNGTLTGLHGFDGEAGAVARVTADFLRQASRMLGAAGVAVDVTYEDSDGSVQKFEHGRTPRDPVPGGPRATLTVHPNAGREQAPKICAAIREALEAGEALDSTQVVILLRTTDDFSMVLSHGYDDRHKITHALLNALLQFSASDDGCMVIVPIVPGHPN